MADTAGMNLREPDQMDWANYNPGSKFQAPPVPLGPDGKPLTFYGLVPKAIEKGVTDEGYRSFTIDPIKIVKSGNGADGYELRFTRVNVKKFMNRKTGQPTNASSVGNFLKSAGILAQPQKNSEYEAAVNTTAGRTVSFTIDWSAYSKDTGERVDGYENFPLDPERPGQRKAILRAGDTYTVRDRAGNVVDTQTVKSEVLFANAKVKFFVDPNRTRK